MAEKKTKKTPVIEVNWRKFAFFSFILLFLFGAWKFIASSKYFADQPAEQTATTIITTSAVSLEVRDDGSVYKNNQKIKSKIQPESDFDELRLIVYDQNGFYLDNLKVNLKLPADVAYKSKPEILAIHGVESASTDIVNSSTISYDATSVGENSTITIVAKIPKGVIQLPFYDQVIFLFSSFGRSVWLTIAIIIPILTLIYLLLLISFQQRIQHVPIPDRSIPTPPMALPPAVVGVLVNQKVGSREIAATLIDLSLRNYIYIIDRDRGFAFGKRSFTGYLLSFEKILLSKIFRQSIEISDKEISQRFVNHLYSHKMSLFTKEVYSLATRLGYFKENPASMHRRYQFFGIMLFFFALICFFLTLKYFPTVPYAIFLWIGMMIASVIVVVVGRTMPIRTSLGRQALSNWLAFEKYLSDSKPLPYDQTNYQKFTEYLPYAVIFHCEAMWARRFADQEFIVPDWFLSDKESLGLRDFCLALYPIIGYVGQNLADIREPGYK